MRQETKMVYMFDELSDDAKEKAREWWRGCVDDYSAVIEDAARMAELLGIEIETRSWKNSYGYEGSEPLIYWSGFCSQGDGASFEGRYEYKKGTVKAILAETGAGREDASKGDRELLRIARQLQDLQRPAFYTLTARMGRGHNSNYYSHSGTMSVDVERSDEREVTEDQEETLAQLMRDFADWIYSQLEQENDWIYSDENVDEAIRANEYEFYVDGSRT